MASFDIKIKSPKKVIKNLGYELWIHNDQQYCGKLLVFPKEGSNFSMHYHMIKNETWLIQSGRFQFDWIDNTKLHRMILNVGDSVYIQKGLPHQLTALENDSSVFEVSTQHFDDDSYRVYRDNPSDLDDIIFVENKKK